MAEGGHRVELPRLDVRSLPGPETISRRVLSNGIVVLARENFSSPSVVLSGFLRVGSLDEPREQAGLADATASATMRGTRRRSFVEVYEAIESIGARFGIGASTHTTSFTGKALAEDLEVVLDLLVEVLLEPTFPKAQVERLLAEKLTSLAIRDQDTSAQAHLAFEELIYPDHPYNQPTDGYRETVAALKPADLRAFHRSHYGPDGMIIAVVGAIRAEAALDAVEARFGGWVNPRQQPQPALPPVSPPSGLLRKQVAVPGKSLSNLVMGVPGPSRFDPDYLAAALGNNILGRFGLMGRIGDVVRESAGLAYHASSSLSGGPGPGPWKVLAGVNPKDVERAIELIRAELQRFVQRRVTVQELNENQAQFIGRVPLQLESNEGVARGLVHMERYALGLDYYLRFPELIAAITRDQVLHVARRFIDPDRLGIAIAGPELPGE